MEGTNDEIIDEVIPRKRRKKKDSVVDENCTETSLDVSNHDEVEVVVTDIRRLSGIYSCDTCFQEFDNSIDYNEHFEDAHNHEGAFGSPKMCSDIVRSLEKSIIYCEPCRKFFDNFVLYNEHLNDFCKCKIFKCYYCQEAFNEKTELFQHIYSNCQVYNNNSPDTTFKSPCEINTIKIIPSSTNMAINISNNPDKTVKGPSALGNGLNTTIESQNGPSTSIIKSLNYPNNTIKSFYNPKMAIVKSLNYPKMTIKTLNYPNMTIKSPSVLDVAINIPNTSGSDTTIKISSALDTMIIHSKKFEENDQGSQYFYCVICNAYHKTKKSLLSHLINSHYVKNIDKYYLLCCICDKIHTKENIADHILDKHFYDNKCEYCDDLFKTNDQIGAHIIDAHSNDDELKLLQCEYCRERFSDTEMIKSHIVNNHLRNHYQYTCVHCDTIYPDKSSLIEHKRQRHQSEELMNILIIVDVLNKSFSFNESDDENVQFSFTLKNISKLNEFVDLCEKVIVTDECMTKNLYSCQFCKALIGQKFSHHMQKHINLKYGYECPACEFIFDIKDDRNSHVEVCKCQTECQAPTLDTTEFDMADTCTSNGENEQTVVTKNSGENATKEIKIASENGRKMIKAANCDHNYCKKEDIAKQLEMRPIFMPTPDTTEFDMADTCTSNGENEQTESTVELMDWISMEGVVCQGKGEYFKENLAVEALEHEESIMEEEIVMKNSDENCAKMDFKETEAEHSNEKPAIETLEQNKENKVEGFVSKNCIENATKKDSKETEGEYSIETLEQNVENKMEGFVTKNSGENATKKNSKETEGEYSIETLEQNVVNQDFVTKNSGENATKKDSKEPEGDYSVETLERNVENQMEGFVTKNSGENATKEIKIASENGRKMIKAAICHHNYCKKEDIAKQLEMRPIYKLKRCWLCSCNRLFFDLHKAASHDDGSRHEIEFIRKIYTSHFFTMEYENFEKNTKNTPFVHGDDKEMKFVCQICISRFETESELINHMLIEYDEVMYSTVGEFRSSFNEQSIKTRTREPTRCSSYECEHCHELYKDFTNYLYHFMISIDCLTDRTNYTDLILYTCKSCTTNSSLRTLFQPHNTRSRRNTVICDKCYKEINGSMTNVIKRMIVKHRFMHKVPIMNYPQKVITTTTSIRKVCTCEECDCEISDIGKRYILQIILDKVRIED